VSDDSQLVVLVALGLLAHSDRPEAMTELARQLVLAHRVDIIRDVARRLYKEGYSEATVPVLQLAIDIENGEMV
jgi:hypothetical protein